MLSQKEVPADFSVQLKAEVSASKIKAKEFDHLKPVLFPVWTVPFHFMNESLDASLWERQIIVTPGKTLKIVEALQLLHQGLTGAMVSRTVCRNLRSCTAFHVVCRYGTAQGSW